MVAEAAATLNKAHLADELQVLCLMLLTRYEEAFRLNPYADSTEASMPFAVMLRDWQQRLGR